MSKKILQVEAEEVETFDGYFDEGLLNRAKKKGAVSLLVNSGRTKYLVEIHKINKYKTV